MKFSTIYTSVFLVLCLGLVSCEIENIDDQNKDPKTDYSNYNYVLATEDASTADITRFFCFNLDEIDTEIPYDLIQDNQKFINSDPSTSSGFYSFKNFIFSMAKDKRGFSSTPGIYRLTLNTNNQVYIRSEEHTSELQSRPQLVCRLLLEKK